MKILWLAVAAILLSIGAVAIWQHRFEEIPGALPETRLSDPLVGWTSAPIQQYRILEEDGETVLRLERKGPDEKFPGIGIWLGRLDQVDFIHVRCEARWTNVVGGPASYQNARLTITPRTGDGSIQYPPEGLLFSGTGDSDWKEYEVVFGLSPDFVETGIRMGMTGDSGRLEIRKLSLVAVRQRPWVPAAVAAILAGWILLLVAVIRRQGPRPSWPRTCLAALSVIAFSWFVIFPQARDHFKPLAGPFSIPGPPPQPGPPASTEALPQASASVRSPNPPEVAKVDSPRASPQPTLHHRLRNLDARFKGLHFVLFSGFTLAFLIITGGGSQWWLPLVLAILAEVIPELTDHFGGWDDWTDLASNLAGVGFAVLLWSKLPLLKQFRKEPAA